MPRIFKHGQLEREAQEYRALLDLYYAREIKYEKIAAINRDLAARYGREGLSRIKQRAWKLLEGRA